MNLFANSKINALERTVIDGKFKVKVLWPAASRMILRRILSPTLTSYFKNRTELENLSLGNRSIFQISRIE